MIEDEEFRIRRLPWRGGRLLFNTWPKPFPYLLHRWEVSCEMGPVAGFFTRRGAERWITEYNNLPE